jgi:hypothetical protein
MPDTNELLRISHEVTSERDPEKRLAAIEPAYVEDLRFIDLEGKLVGRPADRRTQGQLNSGEPNLSASPFATEVGRAVKDTQGRASPSGGTYARRANGSSGLVLRAQIIFLALNPTFGGQRCTHE